MFLKANRAKLTGPEAKVGLVENYSNLARSTVLSVIIIARHNCCSYEIIYHLFHLSLIYAVNRFFIEKHLALIKISLFY